MANPIARIGVPGTSQYRVDYGPMMQDRALAQQGIRDIFGGVKEFADRRNTATLAELFSSGTDHAKLAEFASKRGLLPQLNEMLTTRKALAPPAPETFADVDSPYGRGGFGQRSSKSNRIVGYQPPATPKESKFGNLRSPDGTETWGGAVGSEEWTRRLAGGWSLTGDTSAPETGKAVDFKDAMRLGDNWRKITGTARALTQQRDLMKIGLEQAKAGDMAAGSQAVLVTFQKILDPTSVVRESEYARSASGLSILEQAEGAFKRLQAGGAGLTVEQLESFSRLADRAVDKLTAGLQSERQRVERFADYYKIPRNLIFSGNLGANAPAAPRPPGLPPGGRGPGDEFGSPFDASGLAAPSPFASMDRAGLLKVDPNSLAGDPAALAAYERALDAQINGMRR